MLPVVGNPLAEYIIETQMPVVAPDLLHDPRFEWMWPMAEARDTRAMMIVPVILGDEVIGTIGLDSSKARGFSDAEIELAMTTANQAAVAIEKGRLFSQAQVRAVELNEQAQRLALINRVSSRLAQTLDPQEAYRIVLGELVEALHMHFGGLVIFENEKIGRLALDYPFDHPTPDFTLTLEDNLSISA